MLFSNIVGQEKVKGSLISLGRSQKVPHALLFLGPEGSGNLALALAFAQYLLCDQPQEFDSCGRCSHCLKAHKLIHPDLHFSFPAIGRNAISDHFLQEWRAKILENPYLSLNDWLRAVAGEKPNLQGNINKEECLNIIRKLGLKPFESERKVLVLWLPELLKKEGNRLLKIIEEPPEGTYFLLVAEDQEQILNTILSRCQLVKVGRITEAEMVEKLTTDGLAKPGQADQIALFAGGNFNEALKLAANHSNDHAQIFLDWLRKTYMGNGVQLVKWAENMANLNKEEQKFFFLYGLHFFREFLLLKYSAQIPNRLSPDDRAAALKMKQLLEIGQIEEIIKVLSDAVKALERNGNQKLVFLNSSIAVKQIFKGHSVKISDKKQYRSIVA